MHAASDFMFPPELLDELIDQLDETSTLLSCGLVSKRALLKTRRRLFSTLEFTLDEDFDRFLDLAGAPWTSFKSAVREIHLQDLFLRYYDYGNARDTKTVASNLCNVKTLSIFVHLCHFGGGTLPRSILDIVCELKIHDLQLDGVGMTTTEEMVILFSRLSPTLKILAFRAVRAYAVEDLHPLRHLSIFRRPLHFRILDNLSLTTFLKDVLDPTANPGLDVTVHTFHIRESIFLGDNALTWRFLEHIGHGVVQLVISFTLPSRIASPDESMKYLEPTQVVQLINLRSLFIGFCGVQMHIPLLVSAMWKMLSALPSPHLLEELKFKFTLFDEPLVDDHRCMSELEFFESPNCLDKFRSMFPNLTLIKIILNNRKREKTDMFFETLRRVRGLRELEEIGIVKLATFHMEGHVACHSVLETCM
ncbi:hypothetical protein F5887DRAFT_1283898 [Amanita rubescens]|nr:hypothetical protein F5887DRAFT_1283898 [Amanita rubescens]